MKAWTVMIYMAGDNNLSQECVWAIKEMYRVGVKSEDVAVVVQFDPEPRDLPTYRYDIGKRQAVPVNDNWQMKNAVPTIGVAGDGGLDQEGRPILITRVNKESGQLTRTTVERVASATEIIKFVEKVKHQYEAEHYMLVLSGHGSGAQGDAFLMEGNPPSFISIARLGWAMGEIRDRLGKPLDILGCDACDMNMAEVGYQLRDSVRLLVGAEGFEKNSGWPYFRILEILNEDPTISPEDLARRTVESYVLYYSDYVVAGVSVDLAACDLSQSEALANAVKYLGETLVNNLNKRVVEDAVIIAHWRAQSYKFEEYVDLWDFCDLLDQSIGGHQSEIGEACRAVKTVISDSYVLKSCYSGAAFQFSRGVSICFPWSDQPSKRYHHLHFKDTGWPQVIDRCVAQTRRRPRGAEEAVAKRKQLQPFSLSLENLRINPPLDERVNPPLDERVNPPLDERVNPPLDERVNPPLDERVNPPLDERVNPPFDERVNPPLDERVNPPLDERGLAMLVAKMKNPPVWFYEDDCVIQARAKDAAANPSTPSQKAK